MYLAKGEKRRTKKDADDVIRWLTGYSQKGLEAQLKKQAVSSENAGTGADTPIPCLKGCNPPSYEYYIGFG
jgi:hypothetical protein